MNEFVFTSMRLVFVRLLNEIDDPNRFKNGRLVGAYIGCVPTLYESGEISIKGSISKTGPAYLRSLLHEAAIVLLTRTKKWSKLKAWGMKLARSKGTKKASIALARKMSTILWRMWQTKEPFHHSLKEKDENEKKKAKKDNKKKAAA